MENFDSSYLTEAQPPPQPGDHVALHVLCDHCRAMRLHDRTQNTWAFEVRDRATDIIARSKTCHFCMMLVTLLNTGRSTNESQNRQLTSVVFNAHRKVEHSQPWNEGKVVIEVHVSTRMFDSTGSTATFVLIPYGYQDLSLFEGYLNSNFAPKSPGYNVQQLRGWIQTCLASHPNCAEFQRQSTNMQERPSRILQIDRDRLKLRCDGLAQNEPYVTLSHMWGLEPTRQLILKGENLNTYQEGIALELLPSIYKEAVRLTQILGYEYLWIDSLCIIQDSASDWEAEASKMASTYGNAICNLACLFPPGHFDNHLRSDPRSHIPCALRPATTQTYGVYALQEKIYSQLGYSGFACDWHDHAKWPLFSRAWTFQEHFLSARTIFFGHQALMWECSDSSRDEWLGRVSFDYRNSVAKSRLFQELSQMRLLPQAMTEDITSMVHSLSTWNELIKEYRSRSLTKSEDRIMAFAGLARATHHLTQLTYVAGFWAEFIPLCLLWKINRVEPTTPIGVGDHARAAERAAQAVPSWSWFSVPISPLLELDLGMVEGLLENYPSTGDEDVCCATLSSYKWHSRSSNDRISSTYYDFEGLQLTLNMQICDASIISSDDLIVETSIVEQLNRPYDSATYHLTFFNDVDGEEHHLPPNARLGLLHASHEYDSRDKRGFQRFIGLCLVEGSRKGTWRRVGVWEINLPPPLVRRCDSLLSFQRIEGVEAEEVILV